jgi:hypothetical protein
MREGSGVVQLDVRQTNRSVRITGVLAGILCDVGLIVNKMNAGSSGVIGNRVDNGNKVYRIELRRNDPILKRYYCLKPQSPTH